MITLYSKPNCPYCDRAKVWLENNNISYTTIDVTQDHVALDFVKSQGHKTVPQLYFDGKILVEGGYTGLVKQDPKAIKEMINQRAIA